MLIGEINKFNLAFMLICLNKSKYYYSIPDSSIMISIMIICVIKSR